MTSVSPNKCVAFVCLRSYPLFNARAQGAVGGMETRSALFARGMASRKNWAVEFVVGNYRQPLVESIDGVRFHVYRPIVHPIETNVAPRFAKHKWRPVIHLNRSDLHFLWQLPAFLAIRMAPRYLINRFWRQVSPDVVCCFGNNSLTAEVIADCYRSNIRTVLCVASDDDLSAAYTPSDNRLNDYGTPRWKAWYAIEHADRIFVQTERQRALLRENFGREGHLVRNPVDVSASTREDWPARSTREFVLWIGRSDTFHKRPLLMLDLARACPEIQFVMIVNKTHPGVYEKLQRERPENVAIIERVPHHEIWDFYRRARVFVSTSVYEGFPNTFLQAAVSGVPVASLSVDPEGMLAGHDCGMYAADNPQQLASSVRALWADDALAEAYAGRFFDFVLHNHGLDEQAARFEALLNDVADSPRTPIATSARANPFRRFIRRSATE
jgi:glycosyltransferase involved in cell wall biosynthesis